MYVYVYILKCNNFTLKASISFSEAYRAVCSFSSYVFFTWIQNIISWKNFNLCEIPFYFFSDFIYLICKHQAISGLSFCLDSFLWWFHHTSSHKNISTQVTSNFMSLAQFSPLNFKRVYANDIKWLFKFLRPNI